MGTSLMPFRDPFEGPSRSDRELQRTFGRMLNRTQVEAALTIMHEEARGQLAQVIQANVESLSTLEQRYAQSAPATAARLSAVADAYTASAINALRRW